MISTPSQPSRPRGLRNHRGLKIAVNAPAHPTTNCEESRVRSLAPKRSNTFNNPSPRIVTPFDESRLHGGYNFKAAAGWGGMDLAAPAPVARDIDASPIPVPLDTTAQDSARFYPSPSPPGSATAARPTLHINPPSPIQSRTISFPTASKSCSPIQRVNSRRAPGLSLILPKPMSQLASPTSLDIPCSHPFTPSSQLSSAILTPPCEETDANYAEVYPTGPAEILPGVYLGSAFTAQDSHLLSRLGITAILNVAQELDRPQPSSLPLSPICEFTSSPTPREPTQYLHLPLTHSPDSLPPNLSEAITFIHAAKTSSRPVLVHCAQGVARSAAIVIAYVMWFHGSSVQEAYTFVKQRAPGVCPSVGFVGALCEWQAGGRTI